MEDILRVQINCSSRRQFPFKACETLCVQRLIIIYMRRHSSLSLYSLKKFAQIEFSVKSLTLSCLIWQKNCSRLLEPQKVASKVKICPKVAKHNRERPRHCFVGFCNFWRPKLCLGQYPATYASRLVNKANIISNIKERMTKH